MRDLGNMAESFFAAWCSSVGLIPNGSRIDRTGWDFFVEFPWDNDESVPEDSVRSPIECKVQVKGTDRSDRKVPIRVANLHRLAKAQMPAFFCLLEFEGKDEPQSAYLVHVGEYLIEKTLKRIRTLELEKEDKQFNTRKIIISFEDHERLNIPFGKSLKIAIENYVLGGMEKYITEKNLLLKTLGFEDGSYKISFAMSGEGVIEQMVDASLGLQDKVNVEDFVSYQTRFGIPAKEPVFSGEKGALSFGDIKPLTKAMVRFKEYASSPGILFEARLYVSPLARVLPTKFGKMRLVSEFFQMVFEPFSKTIKYVFSLENKGNSSLRALRDILKVLVLLNKSSVGMILDIEPELFPPISLRISVGESMMDFSDAYKTTEAAVSICQRFNVSENDVSIDMEDLRKSSMEIDRFYHIVNSQPGTIAVTLLTDHESIQWGVKTACIIPFLSVRIGDHTIGCLIAFTGIPTWSQESKLVLVADQTTIESPLLAKADAPIQEDLISQKTNAFVEKLLQQGITPIILAQDNQASQI